MKAFLIYWAICAVLKILLFLILAPLVAESHKNSWLGGLLGFLAMILQFIYIAIDWLAIPGFIIYWFFFR